MNSLPLAVLLWAVVIPAAAADPPQAAPRAVAHSEVLALVAAQADAWNRGDLHGFLAYYQDSADTVFVSGSNVERGLGPIRARYLKRYGTSRETMGVLSFSDLSLVAAGPDVAVVSGAWAVAMGDRRPHGRFTLVWKLVGPAWRIVYDHTSVAPVQPSPPPTLSSTPPPPAPIIEAQSIPVP